MEKKSNDRRKFLNRLALGGAAFASVPFFGAIDKKDEEQKTAVQPIKQIRALGFQWQTHDPFLFCVHHEDQYPKGNDKMGPATSLAGRELGNDFHIRDGWRMYHGKEIPGFPGHPHRGFETLTVVRKGMVDHTDSARGAGRYGDGDLQWMTAGKGLMHSEMFPLIHKDKENPLELFQVWLNLPRKSKMVEPDYKMFWAEDIPKFNHKPGVMVEVLTGTLFGKSSPKPPKESWAGNPENHVGVYNFHLDPNTSFELPATAAGINRTIFYYDGAGMHVEGTPVPAYHAVDVESHIHLCIDSKAEACRFLILQGKPINEPVVQHGPFVMNTREEIQQAFSDYQRDRFGGWPWPRYDYVHDRNAGRFARYIDGREERKG